MLDLNFVKKIDKNWEKRISKVYVKKYKQNYCTNCGSIINDFNTF